MGMNSGHAGACDGHRILIVDDYPHAAEILGRLLKRFGHKVQTATDGRQALEFAERCHPEVIFSDIAMPKLTGYELAEKIREQPWGKHIILVALTTFTTEEDRQRSRNAGFNEHIGKPVFPEKLRSLLDSYLGQSNKKRSAGRMGLSTARRRLTNFGLRLYRNVPDAVLAITVGRNGGLVAFLVGMVVGFNVAFAIFHTRPPAAAAIAK